MTPSAKTVQKLFPMLAEDPYSRTNILNESFLARLPANQPVFLHGAPCNSYLLLVSGSVRVQVISTEGREALLYRVLPGHSCVLTTCCVLSNDAYPAEGHTEAEVIALSIPKAVFERALERSVTFRQFVFANLGVRIAEVIKRIEQVSFQPIERRLAQYLSRQARSGNSLKATHQEIAVELGSVREVVSRHLKRLESRGLVRLGRSTVEIVDLQGLERLFDRPV